MSAPQIGTWWTDPHGARWVVVEVTPDAGGGLAWLRVDGFDPRRPAMIPAWSARAGEMRPADQPEQAQPDQPDPGADPTLFLQRSHFVRPMFAGGPS